MLNVERLRLHGKKKHTAWTVIWRPWGYNMYTKLKFWKLTHSDDYRFVPFFFIFFFTSFTFFTWILYFHMFILLFYIFFPFCWIFFFVSVSTCCFPLERTNLSVICARWTLWNVCQRINAHTYLNNTTQRTQAI